MKAFFRETAWSAAFLIALGVAAFALFALFAGCDAPPKCPNCPTGNEQAWPAALRPAPPEANPYRAVPPMDLPVKLRAANYGGGSCMYASLESVLRWQGRFELASWLRSSYSGAQSVDGLSVICDRKGLRVAYTTSGDAGFLDWCSRTRRGAAIHYWPNHAITFCGYDAGGNAVLLDNNATGKYTRVPKSRFVPAWRGYGGRAMTVVYEPPGPRPWVPRKVGSGQWAVVSAEVTPVALGGRIIYRRYVRPWTPYEARPYVRPYVVPRPYLRPYDRHPLTPSPPHPVIPVPPHPWWP